MAVIVCNMSVIIPAVLRALGIGDPSMRQDTVDPNFSTLEIPCITSTGIELGLPKSRGAAITYSDESEGGDGMAESRRRDSGDMGDKDDHPSLRLTMQASDTSLRRPETKVVLIADEPLADVITDSLTRTRNPPPDQEG